MSANITSPGTDGKKFTVLFNLKDAKRITKEIKRRQAEDEHGTSVSAVLRDLVRTGLPS